MRRGLALLLLCALAGCGETIIAVPKAPPAPPAPRDIPAVPPAFAEAAIAHRKVDGLTIRVYDTGVIATRGSNVSSIKSWSSKAKLAVPAFLIKHPTKGYVLFDTGAGLESGRRSDCVDEPIEVRPGQDIVSQLKADGVEPGQVRWIVLSHLHREHAGALASFPDANVIAGAEEWRAQKERLLVRPDADAVDPARLEAATKPRLVDFSGEPPYGAFDHGIDLFHDGTIILVDLSGHTPGSLGAWVNLDSGPVLLAGDATWLLDNHQDLAIPEKKFIWDPPLYWRRLYEMRAMQDAAVQLVIIPGHDLAVLKIQPRADVTLALPR